MVASQDSDVPHMTEEREGHGEWDWEEDESVVAVTCGLSDGPKVWPLDVEAAVGDDDEKAWRYGPWRWRLLSGTMASSWTSMSPSRGTGSTTGSR